MLAHVVGGDALPAPPWLLSYIGVALVLGTAAALRATWPRARWAADRARAADGHHGRPRPRDRAARVRRRDRGRDHRARLERRQPGALVGGGGVVGRPPDRVPAARRRRAPPEPVRAGRGAARPRPAAATRDAPRPVVDRGGLPRRVVVVPARVPRARFAPGAGHLPDRLRHRGGGGRMAMGPGLARRRRGLRRAVGGGGPHRRRAAGAAAPRSWAPPR